MSKQLVYAGIGSRETPPEILAQMESIGEELARQGVFLRSGNAKGADQAFAKGANKVDPKKVILYLPWVAYEQEAARLENMVVVSVPMSSHETANGLVKKLHPDTTKLSQDGWCFHRRNCYIILGKSMDKPVDLVICWTKNGKATGGTGMGIRIAQEYQIPILNLFDKKVEVDEILEQLLK